MSSQGKYVNIDPDDPEPIGICAASGFAFPRSQLVKQMAYRGDRVVWTGHWISRRFLDPLDPQDKPKVGKGDPFPVKDARPADGGDGLGSFLILTTGDGNTWFWDTGQRVANVPITLLWQ